MERSQHKSLLAPCGVVQIGAIRREVVWGSETKQVINVRVDAPTTIDPVVDVQINIPECLGMALARRISLLDGTEAGAGIAGSWARLIFSHRLVAAGVIDRRRNSEAFVNEGV